MAVRIGVVQPEEAVEAYGWHRGFASSNTHLFPRTRGHYLDLADTYQVVAARDEHGDFLGFCYYSQDEESREWEIGGLMVARNQRGKRLGAALMIATVGNLLIDINPLENGEGVISHVIRGNPAPRNIITEQLQFKHRRAVQIPGHLLPGLETQDDGFVHGDEFEMSLPGTLWALIQWCSEWNDELHDGTPAELILRESMTLAHWCDGFHDMASKYE